MGEMTVTEWTEVFKKLYSDQDKARSPADLWTAAYAHFSAMGEHIRRMDFYDLMNVSATHAFCWFCSFFTKCEGLQSDVFHLKESSLSDVIALKYPGVCGHCREKHCICRPIEQDEKRDKAALYKQLLGLRDDWAVQWHTYTVEMWQQLFWGIYGQQVHMLPLEVIGFHFLEEAGEAAMAVRSLQQLRRAPEEVKGVDGKFLNTLSTVQGTVQLYDEYKKITPQFDSDDPEHIRGRLVKAKMELIVELGDTFSWFCSVLSKVRSIADKCKSKCSYANTAFSEMLLKEYLPYGEPQCPTCHACPCRCKFVQGGSS